MNTVLELAEKYLPTPSAFGLVAAQIGIALAVIIGMWWLRNLGTRKIDDHFEIFVLQNWSMTLQHLGAPLMLAIGAVSAIGGGIDMQGSNHDWSTLGWLGGSVAGLAVFGLIGQRFITWLLLKGEGRTIDPAVRVSRKEKLAAHKAANPEFRYDEKEDTSDARIDTLTEALVYMKVSMSLLIFAFMVGLGFLSFGVLSGGVAPGLENQAIPATLVFFGLNLVALLLGIVLHDKVSGYHLLTRIRRGEMVAAIEASGAVIALSLIIMNATAGDFTGWTESLIGFGVALVLAYGTLYVARWLTDLVILTGCTVKTIQENKQTAASVVMSVFLIVIALLVGVGAGSIVP